ncbi:MAG TPA: efflux RND transporter periplasmic adaptor subunit, partial [Polyangiaceae bacterium]|nr:efflux RND transporter periplasmic adaptor subunit [Polyangiaceae bacterium]
ERERQLAQKDYTTRREVLRAQHELDAARAEAASLAASLAVVGANAGGAGGYTATTPLAGVVTRRLITIGKLAGANEPLFQVVDTSRMWAEVDVPESDLAAVGVGAEVTLTVDGLAGRTFRGAVSYLAPEVDPHTRTARARVALENADGALRANMYGQARIAAGDGRPVVVVPRAAVQRAKGATLAFVRLGPDQFEARRVELGAGRDELVEVTRGVRPGEQVVTEGSFLLKTETLKGSIGAGCCAAD